ncbi:hypothetical protein GCM10023189_04130 [Nibrella saemangeumensis]|uniref:Transposase n=1 Tax=Nibrella saemangeumensis TaxID=1084526 RepID=A0ABP8MAY5_9BACT
MDLVNMPIPQRNTYQYICFYGYVIQFGRLPGRHSGHSIDKLLIQDLFRFRAQGYIIQRAKPR